LGGDDVKGRRLKDSEPIAKVPAGDGWLFEMNYEMASGLVRSTWCVGFGFESPKCWRGSLSLISA